MSVSLSPVSQHQPAWLTNCKDSGSQPSLSSHFYPATSRHAFATESKSFACAEDNHFLTALEKNQVWKKLSLGTTFCGANAVSRKPGFC